MRIKDGFKLREICGEFIVVACGDRNIDFTKVINLNESAATMWNAVIGKDFNAEDLATILLESYDVETTTAYTDANRIMQEWKEIGLTE